MKKRLPVYKISNFKGDLGNGEFYANHLLAHLRQHDFTLHAHKHDFYLVILFTQGTGTHEIDFVKYPVKAGSLFLMKPGQMHHWNLSKNSDGFIFFHDTTFYNGVFNNALLQNHTFYTLFQSSPLISPSKKDFSNLRFLFEEITKEFFNNQNYKFQKLQALVNLTYLDLLRIMPSHTVILHENYLAKLKKLEDLIDVHFKTLKTASAYSELMNMSDKHLNRICKTCLNKTSTELIAERIVLEAKRLLIGSDITVSEVGYTLGYADKSYFTRFFKKHTKQTPQEFLKETRH